MMTFIFQSEQLVTEFTGVEASLLLLPAIAIQLMHFDAVFSMISMVN